MLFATTSNGVYRCNTQTRHVECILGNSAHRGLFKRRSRGFFGIARHAPSGSVLVASREPDDTFLSKPVTKARLYLIDPATLHSELLATIDDVHDVHQIAWHGDHVFLTDTGQNRIVACNPDTGERFVASIRKKRRDINHVNAVVIHEDRILVGLNNRGSQPACVLYMPLSAFMDAAGSQEFELTTASERIQLDNAVHTHDLEPAPGGRMLACKSHDGMVFDIDSQRTWLDLGGWTRGLAFGPDELWVGTSEFADRKKRHNEKLDGSVSCYAMPDLQLQERIVLKNAGQVNDLLYVRDNSASTNNTHNQSE